MGNRPPRDLALLDLIDAQPRTPFAGEAWRIVRAERDVRQGWPAGARWDPGRFDVLYTALERDGALAEIHFHLSRQPVFPSKLRSILYRLRVVAQATLDLADMAALARLGVPIEHYATLDYARCQEIGDAAQFLGFDAILAPSARWPCRNLSLIHI